MFSSVCSVNKYEFIYNIPVELIFVKQIKRGGRNQKVSVNAIVIKPGVQKNL